MNDSIKIFRKADVFLIALMILSAVLLIFIFIATAGEAGYVRVSADGEVFLFSLEEHEGQEIEIITAHGTNTIFIENGTARIAAASCPDHLCVNWGAISATWHVLTCRPNYVAVTLVGVDDEHEHESGMPPIDIHIHQ